MTRPQTLAQALRGVGGPFVIRKAIWPGMYQLLEPARRIPEIAHGPRDLIVRVLRERQQ